ncbi:GNAT family N-acetyltransferase [Sediminibacillus dalangtanensis]|uniref:GNAT family N-acetyltransferase n=1 Tax=Sediminibacillus dalangtanensis TaxID=2729421 RepID=A0ABX7VQJ1_9BACI|nr:GNAT family protein [Sediminibacillus dalangtanensis]QTM99186.1 GNAT family N-acetyltransferase [Sediminibacillus dalangtanensis]
MIFPELETERLHLVEIKKQHASSFFDIMSNDQVTRYYGMNSLVNMEQAEEMIYSLHETYKSGRGIRWGLIVKDSNRFIGTAGLNNLSTYSKKAEIGYEINPDFWRMGYTTEAINKIMQYSFEKLGLYRLGAVTFPQNHASNQLLRKLGFMEEGTLRGYLYQHKQSHDALIFSLLQPEWKQKI